MTSERVPEVLKAAILFPCDWCDQSIRKGDSYAVHVEDEVMSYVHYPHCYNDASDSWREIQSHA